MCCSVLALIVIQSVGVSTFRSAQAACTPDEISSFQTLASKNSLYLLWEYDTSYINITAGSHALYFKKSGDGGKTFGPSIELYTRTSACSIGSHLSMGQDGKGNDNIYVTWYSADGKLSFVASNDGITFSKPVELGKMESGEYEIAADANNGVSVVFDGIDTDSGKPAILFRMSTDGGKSFSDSKPLYTASVEYARYSGLRISQAGQNIYVAWTAANNCSVPCPSEVMFAKSANRGENFSIISDLIKGNNGNSNDTTIQQGNATISNSENIFCSNRDAQPENIAAVGSSVYLALRSDCALSFIHSTDNGNSFSRPVSLFREIPIGSDSFLYSSPYVVAYNNTLYIAWMATNSTGIDMFILKSTDGGDHFKRIESAIPSGFGSRAYPIPEHLAISQNGLLYFEWSPNADRHTVMFEAVSENQTAVATPLLIHSSVNSSFFEDEQHMAASDSGFVYVLWLDTQTSSEGPLQNILVRVSADNGKTFGDVTKVQDIAALPEFGPFPYLVIGLALILVIVLTCTSRGVLGFGSFKHYAE